MNTYIDWTHGVHIVRGGNGNSSGIALSFVALGDIGTRLLSRHEDFINNTLDIFKTRLLEMAWVISRGRSRGSQLRKNLIRGVRFASIDRKGDHSDQ